MQKQASVSTLNVKVHNIIRNKQAKYGLIERAASRKCLLTKKKKNMAERQSCIWPNDKTSGNLSKANRTKVDMSSFIFNSFTVRSTPCLSHPCSKCQESKGKNDQGFITRSHTEGGWYHVTPQRKECLRSKSWCRGIGKKWHLITKNVITHYRKLK